jgi:hypothetical protein
MTSECVKMYTPRNLHDRGDIDYGHRANAFGKAADPTLRATSQKFQLRASSEPSIRSELLGSNVPLVDCNEKNCHNGNVTTSSPRMPIVVTPDEVLCIRIAAEERATYTGGRGNRALYAAG